MTVIPHFVQNELDAGDTDLAKRLSAFNWCDPFDHILPFSDGTVGASDRAHLWGMYSGILAGEEEPPEDIPQPKPTPVEPVWSRQAVGGGAAGMLSDAEIEHERHARKADIASLKAEVARLVLGEEPAPPPLPKTKKARKAHVARSKAEAARAAERQPESTAALARRAGRQSRLVVARAEIARLSVEVERIEAVALERGVIEREAMRDEDEALALLILGM